VKIERGFAISCALLFVSFLLVANYIGAKEQNRGNQTYACAEAHPQGMCSAANTCGSSSDPCRIDIKRKEVVGRLPHQVFPESRKMQFSA